MDRPASAHEPAWTLPGGSADTKPQTSTPSHRLSTASCHLLVCSCSEVIRKYSCGRELPGWFCVQDGPWCKSKARFDALRVHANASWAMQGITEEAFRYRRSRVGLLKVSKNKPELVTASEKIPQELRRLGCFAVRPSTCRDLRISRSSHNRPQARVRGRMHTTDRS